MNVIDSHIHFWDLSKNINNWVFKTNNPLLIKNYLPSDAIKKFNDSIYGVIHIEAHDSVIPTGVEITWLNGIMDNTPNLSYKHIAFVDITLPNKDFASTINQIKQNKNVAGIRHILSYNPKFDYSPCSEDLSKHANIAANLKYLAQNNLIFDCQMYPYQLNNILPAITESGVLSVVDHLALPAWREKDDPDHKLWQDTILGLSEIDNVFIKLSGIDMFRRETEFDEVVKFCLKNVPIGRLIYGSNYPVSFTHDYNYWFDYLNNLGLSATEKEQIFFKNAFDIFFKV